MWNFRPICASDFIIVLDLLEITNQHFLPALLSTYWSYDSRDEFVQVLTSNHFRFILVAATNASAHHSLKRRSSVKSNGMAHSHHELFQTRRTSVPANCISYISTENVSKSEATEISLNSGLDKSYVIGECGHRRALLSGTGYRCEKHGGRRHSRTMLNGSAETPPPPRRQKKHYDSQNASSPSVPAMVNASYSDTGEWRHSFCCSVILSYFDFDKILYYFLIMANCNNCKTIS